MNCSIICSSIPVDKSSTIDEKVVACWLYCGSDWSEKPAPTTLGGGRTCSGKRECRPKKIEFVFNFVINFYSTQEIFIDAVFV